VRAAATSSLGKPISIRVREYGGGRPVRRWIARTRLTSGFAPLQVAITARGKGRRIDIRLRSGAAEPGDAFLADLVSLARAQPGVAPGTAPPAAAAPGASPGVTAPKAAAPKVTRPKSVTPAPPAAPAPAPVPPIGGLTSFRGDWETGDTSQWALTCVAANRLQIVTSPVRQGRYAARFEVRPGDKPSSAGERCEAHRSYKGDESAGQAYYYAWSTMVPVGWVNPKNYGMFLQFHTTWPIAPALEITTQFGEFYLLTRGGDRDNYDGRRTTIVPTLSPGKWNDFAMYVKWGVSGGAVKIWHRVQGQSQFNVVFDKINVPNVLTDNGTASKLLLRTGYYRGSGSPGTAVVYQDGMRRGPTLADVMADFPPS
jgi:hypothetical protein